MQISEIHISCSFIGGFSWKALMEKKADLMASDLEGDNVLMMAISQNHLDVVTWLFRSWGGIGGPGNLKLQAKYRPIMTIPTNPGCHGFSYVYVRMGLLGSIMWFSRTKVNATWGDAWNLPVGACDSTQLGPRSWFCLVFDLHLWKINQLD